MRCTWASVPERFSSFKRKREYISNVHTAHRAHSCTICHISVTVHNSARNENRNLNEAHTPHDYSLCFNNRFKLLHLGRTVNELISFGGLSEPMNWCDRHIIYGWIFFLCMVLLYLNGLFVILPWCWCLRLVFLFLSFVSHFIIKRSDICALASN